MDELKKTGRRLRAVLDQISARQSRWKDLKLKLKEEIQAAGEEAELEFEVRVTDHIEHWESVSLKLNDQDFSYYIKGNKRQVIHKNGASLIFGLMPSGFIKIGMVYPKISDIKEKETPFQEFDLVKNPDEIDPESIRQYIIRFIREIIAWELGENKDIKERIGFKVNQ